MQASALGSFYTFEAVQESLVEAMLLWRRAPDRERGWQIVRSYWPEIKRHGFFGDGDGELNHAEEKPEARPLPLTRAQVAEMNAVGEWFALIPEQDRRLVAMGIAALASGRKRIPWSRLLRRLGMTRGAGALGQRYSRALGVVAFRLNGRSEAEALRLVQRRGDGWQDVIGSSARSVSEAAR